MECRRVRFRSDVLGNYKAAIERLNASGTEQLFAADSQIFETGGVEGTYENYLAHHLGPELDHFRSFKFSDYKVDVRFEGPVALATETYRYRIETQSGEVAERLGVATRSEEHTSELQSLMRISYAVFCLKKKKQ